jgi:hypothetical protein
LLVSCLTYDFPYIPGESAQRTLQLARVNVR